MKRTFLIIGALLLPCGTQCDIPKHRPIGSIIGTAHREKPDLDYVGSLFTGVVEILRSRGFEGRDQPQPSAYRLPGGHEYGNGFFLMPNICCTVSFIRKSAEIRFLEWEYPRHSGVFPTTDEQRTSIRNLAHEIEAYLRARLPESYELRVSFEKRFPLTASHNSERSELNAP